MAGIAPRAEPGGFPDDVLVGRDVELALLRHAADRVRRGTPQLAIVEGRPGVGKSALVRAFAAEQRHEFVVLWARGEEIERHLDFGIIDQLLREAAAAGLAAPPALTRSTSRPDPLEVGHVVLGLVEERTVGRPLVVVVDDAQWADVASLQSISFAYRRVHDRPVLLVAVQRPDAPHLESFHRLVRDGRGHRLRLAGLSAPTLRALVAQRVGVTLTARAAERLHEHTAGNPLESLTLAEELDPVTLASGFGPLPAPRSYASLVLSRLALCSPQAERLVAASAVLGRPTDTGTLARMLELDDLAPPLSEALERGLVRVEFRHGLRNVEVDHPLLRAAVIGDLPPARQAELHRRAATVSSDPDQAFLHRLRAVVGEDAGLAEEAIARARLRLAAGWELSAVELLVAAAGLLADEGRRAEALLMATDRLLDAGDVAAADELLEAVPVGVGGALEHLVRGQRAMLHGDPLGARDQLRRAWNSDPGPAVASRAAGLLATIAANAGRAEPALKWARLALRRGEGSDVGHAMTMLASAWALRGDLAAGLEEVDDWYHALQGPAGRADALLARGILRLWDGQHEAALEALAAVHDPAVPAGPLLVTATAQYSLADVAYRQGRWDDALEIAERLTVALDDSGHRLVGPMAHGVTSFVLAGRGEVAAADAHLAAGRRALELSGAASGGLWLEIGAARFRWRPATTTPWSPASECSPRCCGTPISRRASSRGRPTWSKRSSPSAGWTRRAESWPSFAGASAEEAPTCAPAWGGSEGSSPQRRATTMRRLRSSTGRWPTTRWPPVRSSGAGWSSPRARSTGAPGGAASRLRCWPMPSTASTPWAPNRSGRERHASWTAVGSCHGGAATLAARCSPVPNERSPRSSPMGARIAKWPRTSSSA